MVIQNDSYESIKNWKNSRIKHHLTDTKTLNTFHDKIMNDVFELALKKTIVTYGTPPCKYAWFVMGSAGRSELGPISDQDHGIIFESDINDAASYFLNLGKEISLGLNEVGYPFCEGNVMSSNPIWCKSYIEWETQLTFWMKKSSWDSIRFLQIFFDARILIGELSYVEGLKDFIKQYKEETPSLLIRFMENVMHIKNVIGIFGHFFVESNGTHKDSIDLKNAGYTPYVNAVRLLAIKEGIAVPSTMGRMELLMNKQSYDQYLTIYRNNFKKLLEYRLQSFKSASSYEDVHYVNIKQMSKYEKEELKRILKDGKKLSQYVQGIIEKGC